jgi:hypothetical protein
VRNALAWAMAAHPTVVADVRVSLCRGKPYWQIPAHLKEVAGRAAQEAHSVHDLSRTPDFDRQLAEITEQYLHHRWAVAAGPQIRLDQYLLPDDRTRFRLRWPHYQMDAEGGQLFLREIDRCGGLDPAGSIEAAWTLPPDILPDHESVDVLAGCPLPQRIRLARKALADGRIDAGLTIRSLHEAMYPPATGHGLLYRTWDASQARQMEEHARRLTPVGPVRYTRYLAAATIRALHRLYGEKAVETDAYVMTLPIHVSMPRRHDRPAYARPVCGNYLVAATLCGRRHDASDRGALGEQLARQIETFTRNQADLSFWAMMWAASHLRTSTYQFLFDLQLGYFPLASGFSYYGDIAEPVRSFLGLPVTNMWAAGVIATPPGWNLVFSRFNGRLNLGMTYNRPAVSPELANRYANYLEEEIFALM